MGLLWLECLFQEQGDLSPGPRNPTPTHRQQEAASAGPIVPELQAAWEGSLSQGSVGKEEVGQVSLD